MLRMERCSRSAIACNAYFRAGSMRKISVPESAIQYPVMYRKIQYNQRSCIREVAQGTRGPALLDQRLLPTDSECPARPLLRPVGPIRRFEFFGYQVMGFKLALLLFWVPFPFGYRLVSYQFSFGMSCPSGRDVLISPPHRSSLRHHGLNIGQPHRIGSL